MKYTYLFLLLSQLCIGQTSNLAELLERGQKAITMENFSLAKEIYTSASELFPENTDVWYNLAAAELALGENDNACKHFYKVYALKDYSVGDEIKNYCSNYNDDQIIPLEKVEEKPKFEYKNKQYPFFEGKELNPLFIELLSHRIIKSETIYKKIKENMKILITFGFTKEGLFVHHLSRISDNPDETALLRTEFTKIINEMVTYIPAKNEGKNVDLLGLWSFPLTLKKQ